ncbi:MAG: hypothetical protein Unbinned5089contig1000_3 [Prokaryotic dsDNA virus sp.]|nr:MAG: hypothetical protein Unbinned5089contig1000_3 [Prokaryotic dsDNA virus sp.]|tara:strand:- start:757 stop:1503 length:747 start_codon:yes stop_codon:yes gene_type:complete
MASQNLNVSSEANSGQGDKLRDAFISLRKMFAEVYGITYSSDTQDLSGTTFKVDANRVELTNTANSGTDGYVLTYDDATGGFTLEEKFDGDITGIVAGGGLTGDASSGEASLAVGAGTGITVNLDDVQISDNGVDHQQLSNSYTELSALGTGSSFALNFDSACTFTATMNNNATFTLSNAQQGQVIDLIVSGNFTVTFAETGSTFNKVGTSSYDGSTTNIIQIMCTDDTNGAKVYHFAVGTYASSTTA